MEKSRVGGVHSQLIHRVWLTIKPAEFFTGDDTQSVSGQIGGAIHLDKFGGVDTNNVMETASANLLPAEWRPVHIQLLSGKPGCRINRGESAHTSVRSGNSTLGGMWSPGRGVRSQPAVDPPPGKSIRGITSRWCMIVSPGLTRCMWMVFAANLAIAGGYTRRDSCDTILGHWYAHVGDAPVVPDLAMERVVG